MITDEPITQFSYYVGITSTTFPNPDAGKPCLDFFLEIPPDVKLTVAGSELTGVTEQDDVLMKNARMISSEIDAIRIRTACNNIMPCLFHSKSKITRNEMEILIKTLEKERLMEARCLL